MKVRNYLFLKNYVTSEGANYLFLKNYVTSEGAVSHNVLYKLYQQLSIVASYQVSFYANSYFEYNYQ